MPIFQDINLTDGKNYIPDFIAQTLGYASGGGVNVIGIVAFAAIAFVLYSSAKAYSFPVAFTGVSFMMTILSGVAIKAGIIPSGIFWFCAVMFAASLVILAINKESGSI